MAAGLSTGGRLPNVVIAGVTKAGTTSLFHYLGQHPDVCASDVKEVRYFNALRHGLEPGPVEDYAAHFRHCTGQRYALEATPSYIYGGRAIAGALHQLSPTVRVMISLREPVARCWSWFQFIKSRTGIPKEMSFAAYLDRCEELRLSGSDGANGNQAYWGLGGGCYADWLEDWSEEFGDRLRVLFFDDLVKEPIGTVKEICEWLGLDVDVVDGFAYDVDNKTQQYRLRRLQRLAVVANRRGERFLRQHRVLKDAVRGAYYSLNRSGPKDTMSDTDRARLESFYGPYNARLSQQLASLGLEMPSSWSRAGLERPV